MVGILQRQHFVQKERLHQRCVQLGNVPRLDRGRLLGGLFRHDGIWQTVGREKGERAVDKVEG